MIIYVILYLSSDEENISNNSLHVFYKCEHLNFKEQLIKITENDISVHTWLRQYKILIFSDIL